MSSRVHDATEEPLSEDESTSGSDDQDPETQIEWLAAGREKRSTAGNRLAALLDEAEDEELAALFEEPEDDVEFEGEEDNQSDVDLGSSDEDEEQGHAGDHADEDLTGEKALQREVREERRAKKRKTEAASMKIPAFRKRVKIDPTATKGPTTPAFKLKKNEKSLAGTPEDGPVRSSLRKATKHNKEVTQARIKLKELRRQKTLASMAAAAKRKERDKPKEMTQADRMAEAARTEKANSKSLNRWEQAEKKREQEQKARLAALQNRQMEGPYISWWSGLAGWVDGKLAYVGKKVRIEAAKEVSRPGTSKEGSAVVAGGYDGSIPGSTTPRGTTMPAEPVRPEPALGDESTKTLEVSNAQPTGTEAAPPTDFLEGIHYYASLSESTNKPEPARDAELTPRPRSPPVPVLVERSTRNVLILENFDATAIQHRDVQRRIIMGSAKAAAKMHSKWEQIRPKSMCSSPLTTFFLCYEQRSSVSCAPSRRSRRGSATLPPAFHMRMRTPLRGFVC